MVQAFLQSAGSNLASLDLLGIAAKSSLVLLITAIACWLLRNSSSSMRHRVWILGITSSLLTLFVVGNLPKFSIAILPPMAVEMEGDHENHPNGFQVNSEISSMRAERPDAALMEGGANQETKHASDDPLTIASALPRSSTGSLNPFPVNVADQFDIARLVMFIWISGAFIVLLPFLFAVVLPHLRHRDLEAIIDPEWKNTIVELSKKLGLRARTRAYSSDHQSVPAVYGAVFPYLVMPTGWRHWSQTQLECVLLHELAHLKRHDVAAQYLGRIAAAVYWFNPLAWYALRQLRIERELACDDTVLQTGTRASDYASQLIRTCRMARWSPMNLGVAMAHSARLDDRIIAILDGARYRVLPSRRASWLTAFLMLSLSIAIGVPVMVAGPSMRTGMMDEAPLSSEGATAIEQGTDLPVGEAVGRADASVIARTHQTMTFSGQVLHGETPIEGATITLWQRFIAEGFYKDWHPRESLDSEPKTVAVSGKNGEFEFTISTSDLVDTPKNIWPNPWELIQVVASKDGMGVGWCKVKELNDRKKIWIRNTVPVHGRVIDLEGQPVRGAEVHVLAIQGKAESYSYLAQPTWTGLTRNIKTDDNGRFTIVGLPTNTIDIRLYVQSSSIATKIFRIDQIDSEKLVEVIVEPTKPITGTIVDVESGQPIAGAVVYGEDERMLRTVRALTNERGEYKLLGLPKSKKYALTVHALHPSKYVVRYSDVVDTPGLASLVYNMTMRRGVPVHVRVIDKRTRELLYPEVHYSPTVDNPNFREATRELYHPTDGYRQFHVADADGIVRFCAYPGRGLINIQLQGTRGYLPVGNSPELMENVKTDITFSILGHAYAVVYPKASDEPLELTLEADPGETMAIKLVDDRGMPVEGAAGVNQYFNAFDNEHDMGMMDRAGSPGPHYGKGHGSEIKGDLFTASMLERGKPRLLVFTHREHKLMAMAIGDAEKPLQQITLKPWATVTGRLLDANGNPLVDTEVAVNYPAVKAEGDWPIQPKGKTDALGRFAIERLIPGLEHSLTVKGQSVAIPEATKIVPSPAEVIDLKDLKISFAPQLPASPSK